MTQPMIENKLLEKRAAAFGYDLNIDWREMKLTNTEALADGVKAGLRLERTMAVMKATMAFNHPLYVVMPKRPSRVTTVRASRSNWWARTCDWRWTWPRSTVSMRWSAVLRRSRLTVPNCWAMPVATLQR